MVFQNFKRSIFSRSIKSFEGAEIDIVEANFKSDAYTTNIHWDGYQEHHKTSFSKVWTWNDEGKRTLLTDPIKYHNFGLKWTPEYLG